MSAFHPFAPSSSHFFLLAFCLLASLPSSLTTESFQFCFPVCWPFRLSCPFLEAPAVHSSCCNLNIKKRSHWTVCFAFFFCSYCWPPCLPVSRHADIRHRWSNLVGWGKEHWVVVVNVSVKEQWWVLSLFLQYLPLYKKTKKFHPNPSLSIRLLYSWIWLLDCSIPYEI